MLNRMRNMVRSWLAKLMIALLVLSFAVWGVGDVFINRASRTVATVGSQEVSASVFINAFQAAVDRESGEDETLSVSDALEQGIDDDVLGDLTQRAALNQAAADLALSAPDDMVSEAISSIPAFQDAGGRFDRDRYASQLAFVGQSHKEFEASVRRDVTRARLTAAIASGTAAPEAAYHKYILDGLETRTITYLILEQDNIEAPAPPEEDAILMHLEENQDSFQTRERRDLTFIWVSPDSLSDPESVTDEEVEEYYQSSLDQYSTPATRSLRQIVFETEEEAQDALERMREGVDLFEIAGELGLSEQEVEVGEVLREDLADPIGEVAFAATETGPAGPAQTPFGWAVLDVTAVNEASEQTLEEVREEIVDELALEAARDRVPDISADIEDRRAAGLTLEEVAEELELDLQENAGLDNFGRDAEEIRAENLPEDRAFLRAAFDSLVEEDLDLLEFDDGGIAVLRVDAIDESRDQSLEEAREEIVRILEDEAWDAATEAAAARIQKLVEEAMTLKEDAGARETEMAESSKEMTSEEEGSEASEVDAAEAESSGDSTTEEDDEATETETEVAESPEEMTSEEEGSKATEMDMAEAKSPEESTAEEEDVTAETETEVAESPEEVTSEEEGSEASETDVAEAESPEESTAEEDAVTAETETEVAESPEEVTSEEEGSETSETDMAEAEAELSEDLITEEDIETAELAEADTEASEEATDVDTTEAESAEDAATEEDAEAVEEIALTVEDAEGTTLEEIAESLGLETVTSDPFRRRSPDSALTRELADEVFRVENGHHVGGKARTPRQAVIARLDEITPGEEEDADSEIEQVRPQLRASLGADLLIRFIDRLTEDYGVAINPASVDAALGLLTESN